MAIPALANAELAVMELLWDESGLTARKIRETLYPDAPRAQHGTVQRLLQRLEEKGFVTRDKTLPVHLFSAAVSRESYASGQLESLTAKLTGGSIAPLITHLLQQEKITPDEIKRLRRILEEKKNGGSQS